MRELSGKKVVIVAGPSASGKSYLIRQLMTKRKNHFRDKLYHQLGISLQEPRSRISIGALTKLKSNCKPDHSRKLLKDLIFIHFDTTSRNQHDKQFLLRSIATNCESIKVVTLKTTFDAWHQRMRQRLDLNPTKNPSNSADSIYKLSRLSRQLAKWRYELTYKKWAKIINEIQPDRQIVVRNEDMPLKTKNPKT